MRDVQCVRNIDAVDDEMEVEILGWSLFPDDRLPLGEAECTQCDCKALQHSVYDFDYEVPLVLCDCRVGSNAHPVTMGVYCYNSELREVWLSEQTDTDLILW